MGSIRNYLSQDELAQFADITITDSDEADDQISQAEELIDSYVGPQDKFFDCELVGLAAGGSTTTLQLQTDQQNIYEKDYFLGCMVEIIGGTNNGQRKRCSGSTKAGVLTVDEFTGSIDTTSFYKIFQIAKFPRYEDVTYYDQNGVTQYFKSIPEEVKRAVAAQVEFKIQKGDEYFSGDNADYTAEQIDNYSYQKSPTKSLSKLIAPKAKMLLRGIMNRKGAIIV